MLGPILVADVGGTKTSIGIGIPSDTDLELRDVIAYPSAAGDSLTHLLDRYLQAHNLTPKCAVIAVAGRVDHDTAAITNLRWQVDASEIQRLLGGGHVSLLNDVEAIALSIPYLRASAIEKLQDGASAPHGTLAVVAPGTGLGEAFLIRHGGCATAHPTEGGHASFSPNGSLQVRLLEFLSEHLDHVSVERVCSGSGLQNLYRFLVESEGNAADEAIDRTLAHGSDATPQIVEHARHGSHATCLGAVELFAAILGAEAGNLALKVLASGGVYLGGGMPARIASFLRSDAFRESFCSKGRFSDWLRQVPVSMITHPHAVLLGATGFGITHSAAEGIPR